MNSHIQTNTSEVVAMFYIGNTNSKCKRVEDNKCEVEERHARKYILDVGRTSTEVESHEL